MKNKQERIKIARKIAEEGIVLLKNDVSLPLRRDCMVSVFGVGQVNYASVGGGSGFINPEYKVNYLDGLRSNEDVLVNEDISSVYEAYCEKPAKETEDKILHNIAMVSSVMEELEWEDITVKEAARKSEVAIYIISRVSEEGRDRTLTSGDYYLTDKENKLLKQIRKNFNQLVVILNTCGVMDLEWTEEHRADALLFCGLAGMEGGNAMADILTGRVNPSGKLADTYAIHYSDYPSSQNFGCYVEGYEEIMADEDQFNYWGFIPTRKPAPVGKRIRRPLGGHFPVEYQEGIYVGYRYFDTFGIPVRYGFGHGLSYTTFSIKSAGVEEANDKVCVTVLVENTGDCAGKEVIQVFASTNCEGEEEAPEKVLVDFKKTSLLESGESIEITFEIQKSLFAVYSESKAAYVLYPGEYRIYVGNSLGNLNMAGSICVDSVLMMEKLSNQLKPLKKINELRKADKEHTFPNAPYIQSELQKVWQEPGPEPDVKIPVKRAETVEYTLKDVASRKCTMKQFVNQMTISELVLLMVGIGMNKKESLIGELDAYVAGAGGHTPAFTEYGISTVVMADGPAGIHIDEPCVAFPTGQTAACTWNTDLMAEMGSAAAADAIDNKVDFWLAPGINIHRNPLCGRNFEYYSEDPLLAGKMAAAVVRGAQSLGIGTCVKHFAANNQESNRFEDSDTIATERTLREIYLKPFEIVVKEAKPWVIMSSYNKLNGTYTSARKDLLVDILRKEWGFDGFVVTDWEGDGIHTIASIRAQNDLYMPGFTGQMKHILDAVAHGELEREDLERCAENILMVIIRTKAFRQI